MANSAKFQRIEETLQDVQKTVGKIDARLSKGDVLFARIEERVMVLQTLVYGAVGIGLVALGYKIVNSVL